MNTEVSCSAPLPAEILPAGKESIAMNFDAGFLTRLKQRDPDTCTFLVSSLTPVLDARLRYKLRDHGAIEDIRNETFYRVFCLVDGERIRQPEQLGSFVRGVCDRVAHECRRKTRITEPLSGANWEPADRQPPLDNLLVEQERKALLRREVMKLPAEDRRLIVEMHIEERDRHEMALERGISQTGLNVRLCRAMKRLRTQVLLQQPAATPVPRPCRPATHPATELPVEHRQTRCKPHQPGRWATMAA
jgi:RNA polymerase sigma-70 factor (ECF subfamily)